MSLGHILESTKVLELSLLITFHKKGSFLCHVLVYKWCLITRSAFYRQLTFGVHSSLPAISLLDNVVFRFSTCTDTLRRVSINSF